MAQLILNPAPLRLFEDHEQRDDSSSITSSNGQRINTLRVNAIAVYPDGRRMVTSSWNMVRLWDLKKGVVLKRLEGHYWTTTVDALAVSRDGQLIASGDGSGTLIAWDANIGESLTKPIEVHSSGIPPLARSSGAPSLAHSSGIPSLDFSPDSSLLATGLGNGTIKLWCTKTWELLANGKPINCSTTILCIRFSPSGELLAIATHNDIQIYNMDTKECVANFKGHAAISGSYNNSLAWMPDGTRLLSAGSEADPTIREWDPSTWQQVGDPWKGHFKNIQAISLNSNGTLLASASDDCRVRLWRVSDQRTIVVFKHSSQACCVAFSADNRRILSGDQGKKISEWPVSEDAVPKDGPKDGSKDDLKDSPKEQMTHQAQTYSDFKVLAINSDARKACIAGDLPAAEKHLSLEINADANNHTAYANRAFVMARKLDWDRALHDAIESVRIHPSFVGQISKGIALCGIMQVPAARTAFDLASVFTNGDLKTIHFLFLIKTITLFNAGEYEEAMLRVEELTASPNVDTLACRVVEAYLHVQLGDIALGGVRYNEAVDHFTAAVNASAFFYKSAIHSAYEEFVVLFGWDLKSLWQSANQKQCFALFRAGRIGAAIESYQSIMDKSDEDMKARLRAWFTTL